MSRDLYKELEDLIPDGDYRMKVSERIKEEEFFAKYKETEFPDPNEVEEKENA